MQLCPPCVQRLPARRLHPSAGALAASPPAGLALLQATQSWRKFPISPPFCLAALKLLYPCIPRRSAYDPRGLAWGLAGRVSQSAPRRRKVCAQPPRSERGKNRRDPRGCNERRDSKPRGLICTLQNPYIQLLPPRDESQTRLDAGAFHCSSRDTQSLCIPTSAILVRSSRSFNLISL